MELTRRATLGAALVATSGLNTPVPPIAPYIAACVQSRVIPTTTAGGLDRHAFDENLKTTIDAIEKGAAELNARLLAFPEFSLQVQNGRVPLEAMIASAITVPGKETDKIARAARKARAYVVFTTLERIDAFRGRYFLSAILIGADGSILTNYRKLYGLTNKTRPSDILNDWLSHFGPESLFPVADTEIGRIACPIAIDVEWPEVVRSFVFKGAEIIVNAVASPLSAAGFVTPGTEGEGERIDIRSMVRRVRAFENMTYVLSANYGPIGRDTRPAAVLPSEIIDYRGRVVASRGDGGEGFVSSTIDIEALRQARCTPEYLNHLVQLQVELHRAGYNGAHFATVNSLSRRRIQEASEHDRVLSQDIKALLAKDVLKRPAG